MLKFFDADLGSGVEQFGSGMEKLGSGMLIPDPGSATLKTIQKDNKKILDSSKFPFKGLAANKCLCEP